MKLNFKKLFSICLLGCAVGSVSLVKAKNFSTLEDNMIIDHVNKHGAKDWEILSELTNGERTPEEYANRYNLYIKRYWDEEEDAKIIEMHRILGPNWSEIASNLPYRSAMDVERRYNDIITYELSASVKLDSLIEPIESIKSRPIDFDKFVKYSCYQ